MKALFNKFFQNLGRNLIVLFYFWFIMPLVMYVMDENVLTSPINFLLSGAIYIFILNGYARDKFDKYITFLPISRDSFVSHVFILTALSDIVMFAVLIGFTIHFSKSTELVFSASTLFKLFSSFSIGVAVVGLAMLIYFRFSYSASYTFYLLIFCIPIFIMGFIDGFSGADAGTTGFESIELGAVVPVISLAVFAVEWLLSIKVYRRRDL